MWFLVSEIEARRRIEQGGLQKTVAFRRLSGSGDHWRSRVVLDPILIGQGPSGCHMLSNIWRGQGDPYSVSRGCKWMLEQN